MFCNRNFHEVDTDSSDANSAASSVGCFASPRVLPVPAKEPIEPVDEVDSLLAEDITRLSLKEREQVHDELHGKPSHLVQETPELVESSLAQLDVEVSKIKRKPSYDRALFLSPSYVKARRLRMIALRSEDWDAVRAARKLVDIYQEKERVFGRHVVARDLHITDLDADAQQALRSGAHFELGTDKHGRSVMCSSLAKFAECRSGLSIEQVRWYVSLHASAGVDNSKGTVIVGNMFGLTLENAPKVFQLELSAHNMILPYRHVAAHACTSRGPFKGFLTAWIRLAPVRVRVRINLHVGSPLEVMYELGSLGIPPDVLPFDLDGNLRTGIIHGRLELHLLREKRKLLEDAGEESRSGRIVHPNPTDVLLGRGYSYQSYPGNVYLKSIVQERLYLYDMMRYSDKQQLARSIVDEITAAGARFLRRNADYWVVTEERVSVEKVCMLFRNEGRKTKNG